MTPPGPSPRERDSAAVDLASLPSVDAVLTKASAPLGDYSRAAATDAVRSTIALLREELQSGATVEPSRLSPLAIAEAARRHLDELSRPNLRRVVNATGVVLHTNLGRARLAEEAIEAVAQAARESCNLEYDLNSGARGDRDALVEEHLRALTGAEAATVVNNNAAAVVLALHTLARGREVVVSRGELVEIGGSFRIPDIMESSGAILREVGTTNRTRVADYRAAIGPQTALLMKIHTSNYRIVGFTETAPLEELAALASEHQHVAVIEDLGAGALLDLQPYGLAPEPLVGERLRAGADLVLASGDKLLGGPQCGLVVGRADLVAKLRKNPLKRALRCDKMTLAALEATLRLYRFAANPEQKVPTLRALLRPVDDLRAVGDAAIGLLRAALGDGYEFELVPSTVQAGSGAQPYVAIASLAIAVQPPRGGAVAAEKLFRAANPPILGRIERDRFLLDLRCIDRPDDLVPHKR